MKFTEITPKYLMCVGINPATCPAVFLDDDGNVAVIGKMIVGGLDNRVGLDEAAVSIPKEFFANLKV